MKIYAPVKDFNGLRNNVRFVNGVGETSEPHLIKWFETHGYKVALETPTVKMDDAVFHSISEDNLQVRHEVKNDQIETLNDEVEMMGYAEQEPDFDSMSPLELRDWAVEHGLGSKIRNTRNKEKLLSIIRG